MKRVERLFEAVAISMISTGLTSFIIAGFQVGFCVAIGLGTYILLALEMSENERSKK